MNKKQNQKLEGLSLLYPSVLKYELKRWHIDFEAFRKLKKINQDLLANDYFFMKTAVQQDPWALEYASPRLQDNFNLVRHALLKDASALILASERLVRNKNLVSIAIENTKDKSTIYEILSDKWEEGSEKSWIISILKHKYCRF